MSVIKRTISARASDSEGVVWSYYDNLARKQGGALIDQTKGEPFIGVEGGTRVAHWVIRMRDVPVGCPCFGSEFIRVDKLSESDGVITIHMTVRTLT